MSTDANAAALQEFWQSTAPMSQVRENLNPPNGQYDLTCVKLDPAIDDNGLVYIQGEFKITAPASIANAKFGSDFRRRFYIGTNEDKLAQKPETRLNSRGFGVLKSIARVSQVPTNDQPVATLCSGLLGKPFSSRIETTKSKKDGKEYCDFGRTFSPIGVVPAKLDTEAAAAPVASAAAPNGAAAGATFTS